MPGPLPVALHDGILRMTPCVVTMDAPPISQMRKTEAGEVDAQGCSAGQQRAPYHIQPFGFINEPQSLMTRLGVKGVCTDPGTLTTPPSATDPYTLPDPKPFSKKLHFPRKGTIHYGRPLSTKQGGQRSSLGLTSLKINALRLRILGLLAAA